MPGRLPAISAGLQSACRVTAPLRHTEIHSAGAGVTLLMAVAAGLAVANVYAQPLIDAIGADLRLSEAVLGFVHDVHPDRLRVGSDVRHRSGDRLDRRQLISAMSAGPAPALARRVRGRASGGVPDRYASVGVLAVVAQVIVAYAASSAAPISAAGSWARSRPGSSSASCWHEQCPAASRTCSAGGPSMPLPAQWPNSEWPSCC